MCQPSAIKQGCDRLCDLELLVGASGRGLIDCDVPNNPVRRRHGNWRSPSVAPECLSVLAPGAGLRADPARRALASRSRTSQAS